MPQTFTDATGHEHSVNITLRHRRLIKAAYSIDLLSAAVDKRAMDEIFQRVIDDDAFVFGCLAIITGISSEMLETNADGTTLENASTALIQAIIDFFPQSSPLKVPLRELLEKAKNYTEQVAGTVEAGLLTAMDQLDLSTVPWPSTVPTNGSGESPGSADSGATTSSS